MWNNQTLRVCPPCAKHFSHTQCRTHRTHLQRDRTTAVRADAPFLLRGHDHRRQSASLDLNIFCESFLWRSRNFFRFLLWGLPAGEHQRAPGTSKCIIISQLSWMVLEGRGQGSMSRSQAGHCGSFVEARSEWKEHGDHSPLPKEELASLSPHLLPHMVPRSGSSFLASTVPLASFLMALLLRCHTRHALTQFLPSWETSLFPVPGTDSALLV